MGFYENGLERSAAVCVGLGSVAFGAPPAGALEAGIGLAGVAGFVLGRSAKFGPECARVRRGIQKKVLNDYRAMLKTEGDSWQANADLEAANEALLAGLEGCIIDRARLAASAVTPAGFPDEAVKVILAGLGGVRPDLFGDGKTETLAYRYAADVVRAGITAAVENADYYRQLEPALMFEMASALGEVREDVKHVRAAVDKLVEAEDTSALLNELAEVKAMLANLPEKTAEARARGVSQDALINLARRMHAEIADETQALKQLERAVEIALEVQAEGHRPSNLGGFVEEVLRRVADLSAKGDDEGARREVEAALEDEEARHKEKMLKLLKAGLRQDELLLDALAAASRLLRMFDLTHDDKETAFAALHTLQDEWYERGRDKGLNFDLEVSILLARETVSRAKTSDERGIAQNNLGNALTVLGERESGTARLEQAVTAYRQALEERTRERVPLDWATIQNNLANAVCILGIRESGTARLEEAANAYRQALEEFTRERVPLDWATTQNNLGNALSDLGERESGTARLAEAVTAYRQALEERTQERVPLQWAQTQNNLGTALSSLGSRERGTGRLEEAVSAYRQALEERPRERVPLQWARTQNNLGNALWTLGSRESGTARLEEAVGAFRQALAEFTRERVPLDWATTQNNLGNALQTLGERESGTGQLEEAVGAYRQALEERPRERVPLQWATTQNNLGNALWTLGSRESGTARLEEAVTAYRQALEEWTRERVPLDWATTQNNLGTALVELGKRGGGRAILVEARTSFLQSLEVHREAYGSRHDGEFEEQLAEVDSLIAALDGKE